MNSDAANASVEAVTDFHEAKELDTAKTQGQIATLQLSRTPARQRLRVSQPKALAQPRQ